MILIVHMCKRNHVIRLWEGRGSEIMLIILSCTDDTYTHMCVTHLNSNSLYHTWNVEVPYIIVLGMVNIIFSSENANQITAAQELIEE